MRLGRWEMNRRKARLLLMVLTSALLGSNPGIAGQPTIVPLTIVHDYPNFSADLEGHSVRLLFDLGGDAPLALTQAALDKLGIKATVPGHKVTDINGNTFESRTFEVARLQIGSAVFTNVRGSVDLHANYIGPSLLDAYQVVLDYRGRKMTLIPPGTQLIERAGCRGAPVPFLEGVAKAQTDFGDLTLVWDTGAGVSFVRHARIDPSRVKVVHDAVLTQLFRLNGADFGPLRFRVIEFSEPPGVDGFIGGNFFARHVVCLDFPAKRILIQR